MVRSAASGRRFGTLSAGVVLALLASLVIAGGAEAGAPAPDTWTGAASDYNWSTASNWAGGQAPSAGQALVFPALPSCAADSSTCTSSNNNYPAGTAVQGITIDDRTRYSITGHGITLGSGGITTTSNGPGGVSVPTLSLPIPLGAAQTWSIDGGGESEAASGLALSGSITGPADAPLTADVTNYGELHLSGSVEAGPVTFTGDSTGVAVLSGSSLNGNSGNAVVISGAGIVRVDGPLEMGPLTVSAGVLALARSEAVASVNGAVTLGSSGTLTMHVAGPAATPAPGVDHAQLKASGNIKLGGRLTVSSGNSQCPERGSEYTLVKSTGGTVSGTFSGAPEGAQVVGDCAGGTTYFKIHYTPDSVVVTAVPPAPAGSDTLPPTVSVSTAPKAPPAGQHGYFNARDLARAGGAIKVKVTASDPSGVASLACKDNGRGVTVRGQSGSSPRTGVVRIKHHGTHKVTCRASDRAHPAHTGAAPGSHASITVRIDYFAPIVGLRRLARRTSAATITVRWRGIEHTTAPITYSVRERHTGPGGKKLGAYHQLRHGTKARSGRFGLTRGATTCFSVRGRDRAGNRSRYTRERCITRRR